MRDFTFGRKTVYFRKVAYRTFMNLTLAAAKSYSEAKRIYLKISEYDDSFCVQNNYANVKDDVV